MLVQRFGLASRDQLFHGVDQAYRYGLYSEEWKKLEVDVKLYLLHCLVEEGGLFDDVRVKAHKDRVGVDGLMDRFHFC